MGEPGSRRLRRLKEAESEAKEWAATHSRVSDRLERLLMRLVIFGLVGLVLAQMLAVNPTVRRKLNLLEGTDGYALTADSGWWQQLAGGSKAAVAPAPTQLTVTVSLVKGANTAPGARLLIDGKVVGDFSKGSVTARVEPGQTIVVDGGPLKRELTFQVAGAPGLASPRPGTLVTTYGNRATIGVTKKAP